MRIHCLEGTPSPELGRALEAFEGAFSYPLGVGRSFRISHGDDYHRFFGAIGRAACFVAEEDNAVLGTVAVVIRALGMPDGTERTVAYVADLKVAQPARMGPALLGLARAAEHWGRRWADAAFAVVMDGTRIHPMSYGGRAAILTWNELGRVLILRFSAEEASRLEATVDPEDVTEPDAALGEACYRDLSRARHWSPGGSPGARSSMPPRWLVWRNGLACGRLEDTRRGKRLILDDGSELVSAHLGAFAFRTPAAGVALIAASLRRAVDLGYPGLFAAVAEADAERIDRALPAGVALRARALVYGAGLEAGREWHINTAEI